MAESKGFTINKNVTITEEVIQIIAGLAAAEVDGVKSLNGGLSGAVIAKAGASRLQKAVKIAVDGENNLVVRISLVLDYGFEIPVVCEQVQEKIKSTVENMTGLPVSDVDIRIASVEMD